MYQHKISCKYSVNGLRDYVARGGWSRAKRYRRADMQIRPYHFRKFNGAERILYFVMYEFSNQIKVVHNVMPIDLLAQSAVLFMRGFNRRADMQIRPYRFRKFNGAERILYFVMYEFSNQIKVVHNVMPIDLLAQSAVLFVRGFNLRADMQIRPYRFRKFNGAERILYFVMYEFSNQVKVLHSVTPIDLLAQSAVLFVRGFNLRADMQIRPYRFRKFDGASGYAWVMMLLF